MEKVNDLDEMVLVRVKSASHPSCEDVEFSCDPKLTTVRQVKEKIRTLYSFHPDIADQRLIYAGHLLDDVQLLTDIFGLSGGSFTSQTGYQHSGPYTIHLACTSKSYISSSQRVPRSDNSAEASSQGSVFSSQIPNPMMQDPRHVNHPNPFEINGNTGIPPEFYALHQLYVEQMSAYMRTWSIAQTLSSGVPVFGVAPGIPPFQNANIPPNVAPNNAPPQAAAAAAPPQNEAPRAAGANFGGLGGLIGGPAAGNDDEENQRDLLDWAYTLSRVFLILGVVYFYSNFTRFLLVVIFTLAIALFQRRPMLNQQQPGRNNQGNERQRNNNNNNPPPPGAPANPNRNEGDQANGNQPNAASPENDENVQAEAAAAGGDSPDAPGQAAAEGNIVAGAGAGQHRFAYYRDVTWTFLTTFFTSLIPEMPQHN